jgi:ubiquinone/menaquinone biosynthesis C-methylase UbiE
LANQCLKPHGFLGRHVLRNMNKRHSSVTDWGLGHTTIEPTDIILDAGCGGGRTISKLAAKASSGKVYGIDFSSNSVAVSKQTNADLIRTGRVEIQEASVSQLPFLDSSFDLITAVETHFWWPDPQNDLRELTRTLKAGGTLVLIAEIYRGSTSKIAQLAEKHLPKTGMKLMTVDQHRELLENAGLRDVQVSTQPDKGWICVRGKKS